MANNSDLFDWLTNQNSSDGDNISKLSKVLLVYYQIWKNNVISIMGILITEELSYLLLVGVGFLAGKQQRLLSRKALTENQVVSTSSWSAED